MTTVKIHVNKKAVLADRVSCRTRRRIRDIVKLFRIKIDTARTRQFDLAYDRTVTLPTDKVAAFKKAIKAIKHVTTKA